MMLRFNTLPRQIALGVTCLAVACASLAQTSAPPAKNPALEKALTDSATQARVPPTPSGVRTADYIMAVVNSEPITRNEVLARSQRVLQNMAEQGAQQLPSTEELMPDVLERLILETDCPYLAPVPYRGKRNSSLYLPHVVGKLAEIKGISEEEVIQVTEQNAVTMYRL